MLLTGPAQTAVLPKLARKRPRDGRDEHLWLETIASSLVPQSIVETRYKSSCKVKYAALATFSSL